MSHKCSNRPELEAFLKENQINFETVEHEEVFTVEAMSAHFGQMPGFHHKNLFLRDKKRGKLYLLVTGHDTPVKMTEVGKALGVGASNLRFGPEDALFESLGVKQGSVTLYALVNDIENQKVQLLLEKKVLNDGDAKVWFHPMQNDATTALSASDLNKFLEIIQHKPILLEFSAESVTVVT